MPFTEGAAAFRATPFADVVAFAGDASSPRSPLDTILASLDDAKAEDVVDLDVSAKTPITDHMVICTGRSSRHVGAIADHVAKDLKDAGFGTVAIEGQPACDWVLIDAGDLVIHLFRPDARELYRIERMWGPESPGASDAAAG